MCVGGVGSTYTAFPNRMDDMKRAEVERAFGNLMCWRTSGIDEITVEMLKFGEVVTDELLSICNLVER